MKRLLSEIINGIKPDRKYEENILSRTDNIIKKLNKTVRGAEAILGGSGAKGTWLKTFDADIFIKFNYNKYKDKSDKLSDILGKNLKKIYPKAKRLHGSRDYFQIKQDKFTFEVIPILSIRKAEEAKNITDVSPLHSQFVLKSMKIKDTQKSKGFLVSLGNQRFQRDFQDTKNVKRFLVYNKLADEIRLTKQFCKACNVYGAESYIRGFSGYICEILTIYYGSFLKLIKNAAKWKDEVVIDIKKYYKGKDIFKEVNKSKLVSPLIVIDPVQKDRNAAAALNIEKFELFNKKAREFLKNPTKEFFEIKEFNIDNIKEKFKNKNLVFLESEPLKRKQDVAGAKLMKIFEFLSKELIKKDFKIIENGWNWDGKKKAYFYFVSENKLLSTTKELIGPPEKLKFHVNKFKKKYKRTIIRKKRILAIIKRKFREPGGLIKDIIKDDYIKDKVRNIKMIK